LNGDRREQFGRRLSSFLVGVEALLPERDSAGHRSAREPAAIMAAFMACRKPYPPDANRKPVLVRALTTKEADRP
jgi:hypothetical protein